MKKGCTQMIFSSIILAVACVAAQIGGSFYTYQVQVKECYDYARYKALPDLEYLEFSGVVVATNQFHGHICRFTDRRTGLPVSLEFDAADVPYGSDTMQVMSMVVPFICVGVLVFGISNRKTHVHELIRV